MAFRAWAQISVSLGWQPTAGIQGPGPTLQARRALQARKGPCVCGETANTVLCSLGVQLAFLCFVFRWGRAPIFEWEIAECSVMRAVTT